MPNETNFLDLNPQPTRLNYVRLIASVTSQDQKRFEDFRDSLQPILDAKRCPFVVERVGSRRQLSDALTNAAHEAQAGRIPLLILLMHGTATRGLICADDTALPFSEALASLRSINQHTQNNLIVFSAACFSWRIVETLSIETATPFYMLIAPKNEADMDYVENNSALFFRDVFEGTDAIRSYEENLTQDFSLFHCEKVLAVLLIRHFRDRCIGKSRVQRREELLTQIREEGLTLRGKTLAEIRAIVRRHTLPNQDALDRHAAAFLIGRPINFTAEQLECLARSARRTEHDESARQSRLDKASKRLGIAS